MDERQQDVLRIQPQMITALRAAFSVARDQLNDALLDLGRRGYMSAPWLGDEASSEVAAHYRLRAMDAPDSSYRSLVAYRSELDRIYDTLQQMETDYHRTEAQAANTVRRRA